ALLEELEALVATSSPAEMVEAVLERTGYLNELVNSKDIQDESRVENLEEFVGVAREFEASFDAVAVGDDTAEAGDGAAEPTLVGFREQISLIADADQVPDADEQGGAVPLMTLHSAKGLEFPVVFLTGLEDGVFPHLRTLGDRSALEEERRLAYVGITRAQERLYLSRAAVRSSWGAPAYNPASRFLDGIPAELVTWRREESSMESLRRSASPARGAAARRPERRVPSLRPGDKVNHDSFGLGTVLLVDGTGDRTK